MATTISTRAILFGELVLFKYNVLKIILLFILSCSVEFHPINSRSKFKLAERQERKTRKDR